MVNKIYGGNKESCGSTVYNMDDVAHCSMQSYQRWGKEHKGITKPNIVTLSSLHPRYAKVCRNYDIELRVSEVSPHGALYFSDIESLINKNTVALVCSAPTISTGRLEPVGRLAALAKKHQIGLHVDSTLGFFTPFLEKAGYSGPPTDFRVEGVTSIGVCLSTYGRMPPGCAVLLFRTKQLRRFQYYGYNKWVGGQFLASGLLGSRTSASSAACWAKMQMIGYNGFVQHTTNILKAARAYWGVVQEQAGVSPYEESEEAVLTTVVFKADRVDSWLLADSLEDHGWKMDRLMLSGHKAIGFTITEVNMSSVDDFKKNLKSALAKCTDKPKDIECKERLLLEQP